MCRYNNKVCVIIRATLSESHSNVENSTVVHAQRIMGKTALQHTTVVWYSGSYTSKHDKFMDNSIQVLWQKCLTLCTDIPYKAGMINHATMNKTAKITDAIFVWHAEWAPSTILTKTG